ncbi:hypothetical protein ACI6PS_07055 [Flavobacterium sp. PLA-1-15]|uniref:hypothetical protein n=1 Tax=Flavobacterium sp. PLA-1-15 TaxID=3380533 RepID=UPI003B7E5CB0
MLLGSDFGFLHTTRCSLRRFFGEYFMRFLIELLYGASLCDLSCVEMTRLGREDWEEKIVVIT